MPAPSASSGVFLAWRRRCLPSSQQHAPVSRKKTTPPTMIPARIGVLNGSPLFGGGASALSDCWAAGSLGTGVERYVSVLDPVGMNSSDVESVFAPPVERAVDEDIGEGVAGVGVVGSSEVDISVSGAAVGEVDDSPGGIVSVIARPAL